MPKTRERSTTPPAFDPVQFAKDCDARVKTQWPRSETRIVMRSSTSDATTDEVWAHSMTGTPVLAISPHELRGLPLDHRSGFLLSLMDGTLDLETILEVSAMPRADALRAARDLFEAGVVEFR
jgi:hypothetical protein